MLKCNIGVIDRLLRFILALVLLFLFLAEFVIGTPGILLVVFSIILTITSALAICPFYLVMSFNTTEL